MSRASNVLVTVPVYNHSATLRAVVEGVLRIHSAVLVVDDGSTDNGAEVLAGIDVPVIRFPENRGKGAAILAAAKWAAEHDYTHILTIDADGQHDPAEIPLLLSAVGAEPDAVVIGRRTFPAENVPIATRFGRRFSAFWLRVQTGQPVSDPQSGFRVYPVNVLHGLRLREKRFAFEIEVLVKTAWAGFPLREVDVRVHYPPPGERVSHFHKLWDNVRISLLNTRLTARAFLPLPHRQMETNEDGGVTVIHPLRSLRILLARENTPLQLAMAATLGVLLGTLPLIGLHSMAIIIVTGYLGLSKITGLATSQLCIPPIVPALCIETGYFLRHGDFLTEVSMQTLGYQAMDRILEWVLGSLVAGPVLGLAVGAVVYIMALGVGRSLRKAKQA